MKLATYRDGSRDGQLMVVSRDLSTAHYAAGIATRLQQVLDDWNFLSPQLEDLYTTLNQGKARHAFSFDPARCSAPLPRAYQWVCEGPGQVGDRPRMLQVAGDKLGGACDCVALLGAAPAVRFDARLAAITGDVAAGASPHQALEGIRLLMLASDACLVQRGDATQDDSIDPPSARLVSAFSPVAVTPDELGAAWRSGRMQLDLQQHQRGERAVMHAAAASRFHHGELIAHVARVRPVGAGSVVGTVALAEAGKPCGPGDGLRLQVKGADGQCVFGAIDQQVAAAHDPARSPEGLISERAARSARALQ